MCLTKVKLNDRSNGKTIQGWKIFNTGSYSQLKGLYGYIINYQYREGLNTDTSRKRLMEPGTDDPQFYLTGYHVFTNLEEAKSLMPRQRNTRWCLRAVTLTNITATGLCELGVRIKKLNKVKIAVGRKMVIHSTVRHPRKLTHVIT